MPTFSFFERPVVALLAALLLLPAAATAAVVRQDDTEIGRDLKLPVYRWSDDAVATRGTIFAIHGATLYALRFDTTARHFAQLGYQVYALDLRGFGRWRTEGDKFSDGDDKIHYTMSEQDIVAVLTQLRKTYPKQKIFCLGESLGANLAVWVGSKHADLADGVIMVSPCIKNYLHPGPWLLADTIVGLWAPDRQVCLSGRIKRWLSDDQLVTKEYLSDPGIRHTFSATELVKSIKTNKLALLDVENIPPAMPVLVLAGKADKIYKASAIAPFVARLGSKRKSVEIVPRKGHLLLEHKRPAPQILSIIDDWLKTNDARADTIADQP